MPIVEKGYQPYEGKRLPTRLTHWVITWLEVRRIWSSILVKIVVILSGIWALINVLWVAGSGYFVVQRLESFGAQGDPEQIRRILAEELPPGVVLENINAQIVFVILLSLSWGAGTIASDIKGRALQFYFAKPVTEKSYLIGKIVPLAMYCFFICLIPGFFSALIEAGLLVGHGLAPSRAALILPAILYSAIIALVFSICSVGISSLGKNRLVTLSYWAAIVFAPWAVAGVVALATNNEFQWFYLASPITMVTHLGQDIFRIESDVESQIKWYHAILVLSSLTVASIWIAWKRLSKAEVVG